MDANKPVPDPTKIPSGCVVETPAGCFAALAIAGSALVVGGMGASTPEAQPLPRPDPIIQPAEKPLGKATLAPTPTATTSSSGAATTPINVTSPSL